MVFVAIASLVLYFAFILIQTVRHCDYFLADDDNPAHHAEPPSRKVALISLIFLIVCLGIVVLLTKALSTVVESMVVSAGAPLALVGVIIAAVVLMPEGLAALRNRLQTSVNLVLGSALASIRLTIPAVVIVCLLYGIVSLVILSAYVFTVIVP